MQLNLFLENILVIVIFLDKWVIKYNIYIFLYNKITNILIITVLLTTCLIKLSIMFKFKLYVLTVCIVLNEETFQRLTVPFTLIQTTPNL